MRYGNFMRSAALAGMLAMPMSSYSLDLTDKTPAMQQEKKDIVADVDYKIEIGEDMKHYVEIFLQNVDDNAYKGILDVGNKALPKKRQYTMSDKGTVFTYRIEASETESATGEEKIIFEAQRRGSDVTVSIDATHNYFSLISRLLTELTTGKTTNPEAEEGLKGFEYYSSLQH